MKKTYISTIKGTGYSLTIGYVHKDQECIWQISYSDPEDRGSWENKHAAVGVAPTFREAELRGSMKAWELKTRAEEEKLNRSIWLEKVMDFRRKAWEEIEKFQQIQREDGLNHAGEERMKECWDLFNQAEDLSRGAER